MGAWRKGVLGPPDFALRARSGKRGGGGFVFERGGFWISHTREMGAVFPGSRQRVHTEADHPTGHGENWGGGIDEDAEKRTILRSKKRG